MVRPRLEYSSKVWDPQLTSDDHTLEQVQRRAARFVHRNYTQRTPGYVTNMVHSLGCESLQQRRYTDRLLMLFKIQHRLVDISTEFVQPGDSRTRGSQRIRQLEDNNDVHKSSLYPRTISDWNRLPTSVTNSQSIQGLMEALACLPTTLNHH